MRKFALIHTGSGDSQPEKNWLMHLMKPDPGQRPATAAATASCDGPVEFPEHVEPMLATLTDAGALR